MIDQPPFERKPPYFYVEPTEQEVEQSGPLMADIHARMRARVVGSRAFSSAMALAGGTVFTAKDVLTGVDMKPTEIIFNFVLAAAVNGVGQIKVERQLKQTDRELTEISPDFSNIDTATSQRKKPRYYKEPSVEEKEVRGPFLADIHARMRARILGSRALSATMAAGVGTLFSATDLLADPTTKPTDVVVNFVLAAIVNGAGQIKVELELRHIDEELADALPRLIDGLGNDS